MGLPAKLLSPDEHEVLHLRTHPKKLVAPAFWFVVLAALMGAGLALVPKWLPRLLQPWAMGLWVLAVVIAGLVLVGEPILAWLTTTYTFTDRRIISRSGVLSKSGHDLPLRRVNDVAYRRSIIDRIFGSGTLELTTASEQPVVLRDIPDIERVNLVMNDLLFADEDSDGEHLD